ncbi:MerR family transcriptional regulator [Streptococcus sp. H49]|uniref:MerR family transcriptional regulator n=1 Tax=Streptococcus huangxiaojuni TaxID=3237239 RepID=UPI0034A5AC15
MTNQNTYTITQVSEKYNINPNTLRYYERIGLLPPVPRKSNGNRYFTDDLNKWLEMIICFRHSGIPIEALLDYCQLLRQGSSTLEAREALLREQREMLLEKQANLQRSIDRLSHKISLYETGEILKDDSYYEEYGIFFDKDGSWKQS